MIKVKWLKAHFRFAYSAGMIGYVTPIWASKLLPLGYIMLVPDEGTGSDGKVNTLPEDLPGRDKLFEAGYDNLEKIKESGDGLLDVTGISNAMLKKITKYLKES